MLRATVLATLLLGVPHAVTAQALSVLHIKVVLLDAERKATPIPRHALLISDNPATAAPRLVVTGMDGTADVKLRPGNYTVESDKPVAFNGKAYEWTQIVDVKAGRDAVLELTADNAQVAAASPDATAGSATPENDPWVLLPPWQDSVVALWTPTIRASGFVIDANGLIATNQRVIGASTAVEVQLTPALKVAATVLAADAQRDVAVLWIDPKAIASVKPVPLGCGQAASVANGEEIFTIGVPMRQLKGITPGTVTGKEAQSLAADFRLSRGAFGGPVFTAGGGFVGITSLPPAKGDQDDNDENLRGDPRVIPAAVACDVVAAAEKKMASAAPPSGTGLPVEPASSFPVEALKKAAEHRAGSLNPYQVAAADFDVAFITPVLTYGAQYQAEQMRNRARGSSGKSGGGARMVDVDPGIVRPIMDFRNWSDYVDQFPPVLLIRVTPKATEGFWTTVARGAASTQGMAIPPIKRIKSTFSRMRTFCGDAEVTPIHPFKIEQRVGDNTIYEGLYVFDPAALGPQCGSVKVVLYSEREPEKGDPRIVDPRVVEQIWQDFEPYRTPAR
jgi:S1-C subfamily serine protease